MLHKGDDSMKSKEEINNDLEYLHSIVEKYPNSYEEFKNIYLKCYDVKETINRIELINTMKLYM